MKKTKKWLFIALAALMALSLAACGSGGDNQEGGAGQGAGQSGAGQAGGDSNSGDGNSGDGKVYEWKIASIYNDPASATEFNSLALGQQKFVDLVNERSNGRIVITPYYNSVLGGELELFQKLRLGDLEVFYGTLSSSVDNRFGAYNIPYLFQNLDEVEKANDPENGWLFMLSEQWLQEHEGKLLAVGASAFRGFANSKHPVKQVGDLKDLKVRTYEDPIVSLFWGGISSAVQLPFSEVYTALQTKAVDGLEFQATSILGRKMDEVTGYYTNIDWQWISGANIIAGEKVWNELPDDLKEVVRQAAIEATKYQGQLQKEDDVKALEEMEARGMEVHRLTPEERQEWVEYANSLEPQLKEAIGEDLYNEVITQKSSQQ